MQNFGLDCYDYDASKYEKLQDFFDTFPMINFDFKAEKLYRLHPEDYLVRPEGESQFCVAIKTLKNMILGGVFWRNYDIKIDKEKKTISFARADCGRAGNITDRTGSKTDVSDMDWINFRIIQKKPKKQMRKRQDRYRKLTGSLKMLDPKEIRNHMGKL